MKGKPLLPTLRTKKRYVAYEVICDDAVEMKGVYQDIKKSYQDCFGQVGASFAGLMDTRIINKNKGILKINHKYLDELRLAMANMKRLDEKPIIVHTVGVSGMLAKTKKCIGG